MDAYSDEYHNKMNLENIIRIKNLREQTKNLINEIVKYNSAEREKFDKDNKGYIHKYIARFKRNGDADKIKTIYALFVMWSQSDIYKQILRNLLLDIVDDAKYEKILIKFYEMTQKNETFKVWNFYQDIQKKVAAKAAVTTTKAEAGADTTTKADAVKSGDVKLAFTNADLNDEFAFVKTFGAPIQTAPIQPESIKSSLQNMLTKLPQPDDKKTEEQYRKEYIDINNNEGELFTYEEEKEDDVHSIGGRTQKKKKKRVQNRRRQKTIKNKV